MGFVFQVPTIVGGTVLVIEQVESQNYVAGVSGWAIVADGTAEFANLIARGTLVGGRVVINGTAYPNAVALYTDNPSEVEPATVEPSGSGGNHGILQLNSPKLQPSITPPAQMTFSGYDDGHGSIEQDVTGSVRTTASTSITLEAGTSLRLSNDFTAYAEVVGGIVQTDGETWHNVARVNGWADFAGSRARYFKDGAGVVHVNGIVASGTAALIGTLPVGYRPAQSHEFALAGAAASNVLCSVRIDSTGAITVLSNLASAQARLPLDFAFPTFT